jgi:hypothetical protein
MAQPRMQLVQVLSAAGISCLCTAVVLAKWCCVAVTEGWVSLAAAQAVTLAL